MKYAMMTLVLVMLSVPAYGDSLWEPAPASYGGNSLYTDDTATAVGDIITILVVESATASQKAAKSTTRDSEIKGEVKEWFNIDFGKMTTTPAQTLPAWEIDTENQFEGGGTYSGNYAVKGQITTRVVEVMPNGNLLVEGQNQVKINEEVNTIAVAGIVRPQDIGPSNTVLSTQVADAKIHIVGKGPLNDKTNRGILGRLLDFVWPF
ncbi:MAG: hypothetical protein GF333_05155 [Candidatus Omnitrophica bacterium]|nr:hypothetical protein [Candidatus Omnitrophota bacterium]